MKFSSYVPTAQRGKLRFSIAYAHTAGEGLLARHSWPDAALLWWSLALTAQGSGLYPYACQEAKTQDPFSECQPHQKPYQGLCLHGVL